MKKLRAVIHYECATSFKYVWIFYAVMFSVVALISLIVAVSTGDMDKVGTDCLEVNSVVYVGVLGVLGFKEDFKMLIQNGFTRKYIFIATFSLFAFISALLALVDTIVGQLLHRLLANGYDSLFGAAYGYGQPVIMNLVLLFLLYITICSVMYLGVLAVNRLGKRLSLVVGLALLLVLVLLVPVVFRYGFSESAREDVVLFLEQSAGFMPDGRISLINPVLAFILISGVFAAGSYLIIRRTELKV